MSTISKAVELLGGPAAAARALAVSPQAVSFWLSGRRLPSAETSIAIEKATAGVVTVERTGAELLADPVAAQALLLDACHQALAQGVVQSIVIGGAALADLAAPLAPQLPVPLIDNVRVGLQAAWAAAVRAAAAAPA